VWRARELPSSALAALTADAARSDDEPAQRPVTAATLPVGAVAQHDGRHAVRALAPLGRLTATMLERAAALAEQHATDVRIDHERGVTLVDLASREAAATVLSALAALGLLTTAADPAAGLTACAGAACTRTTVDVRGAARIRATTRRAGDVREHLVGCDRRCGAPRTGLTVIAEPTDSAATLAARAATAHHDQRVAPC
jgi:precorrin-3B synthase